MGIVHKLGQHLGHVSTFWYEVSTLAGKVNYDRSFMDHIERNCRKMESNVNYDLPLVNYDRPLINYNQPLLGHIGKMT